MKLKRKNPGTGENYKPRDVFERIKKARALGFTVKLSRSRKEPYGKSYRHVLDVVVSHPKYGQDYYKVESFNTRAQAEAITKLIGKLKSRRKNPSSDPIAARELKLYIEKDSRFYHSKILPIQKNLLSKMKAGKYEHQKAPTLWKYLVEEGARQYRKDFGDTFSPTVRKEVAKEFANEFLQDVKAGEHG